MPTAEIADVFLKLLDEVPEAGTTLIRARGDGGHAEARKIDIGHPEKIRHGVSQSLEAQKIDDLAAPDRTVARVVAEGQAIAGLAHQVRTDAVGERGGEGAGVAHAMD